MAIVWGNATDHYQAGVNVTVTGNTKDSKTATVTVQPYLRNTSGVSKRYQHDWMVRYYKNGVEDTTKRFTGLLPNTNTSPAITQGWIPLTKNTAYKWGPARTFTINKTNASTATFTIKLECRETTPWKLAQPKAVEVSFVRYTVVPSTPTGSTHQFFTFNANTRTVSWNWDNTTNCEYVTLRRQMFNESGNKLVDGNFKYKNTDKLYDKNRPFTEVISDEVSKIIFTITNYSSTGDKKSVTQTQNNIETISKVWVKVSGQWKKAIPWIKVDGQWKKCKRVYCKANGTWNRVKT